MTSYKLRDPCSCYWQNVKKTDCIVSRTFSHFPLRARWNIILGWDEQVCNMSVQNMLHSFPPFPTTSWHAIHKCMIELNFFNVSRRVSYFDVKVFWKYDKIDLLQKVNQSTYCPLSNTLTTAQNIEENLISTLQFYIEMSNRLILVSSAHLSLRIDII